MHPDADDILEDWYQARKRVAELLEVSGRIDREKYPVASTVLENALSREKIVLNDLRRSMEITVRSTRDDA